MSLASTGLLIALAQAASGTAPGPLPEPARALPVEGLLIGFDATAFFGSELWKELSSGRLVRPGAPPSEPLASMGSELREAIAKGLADAESKSGVRLDRDIEAAFFTLAGAGAREQQLALMVLGRFDLARVEAALATGQEALGQKLTRRDVAGVSMLLAQKAGRDEFAAALPDKTTLILGTPALVEQTLANRARGRNALAEAPALRALADAVRPGVGLWLVAEGRAFEGARPAAGGPASAFPQPRSVRLSVGLDASLELVGELADEATARNTADLVRGFVAMGRMQASQQQDSSQKAVAEALGSVSVEQNGTMLRLAAVPKPGAPVLATIAAAALPSLLRARASANEAAAIGDVRSVLSAQAAFSGVNRGAYAELSCLSAPRSCLPRYAGPAFLDPALASLGAKGGYERAFFPGRSKRAGAKSYNAFAYTATPLEPGRTGTRSFCGDSSGVVCADATGAAIRPLAGACPSTCTPLP